MKNTLLAIAAFTAPLLAQSQGCNEVFISEMVEGWSNNKAIEIYNPTPNPIDVSNYGLVRFQNGSTNYGEISYLDGVVIQPFDVVVVVLDKRDSLGQGLEAPVWDELQDVADIYINPNYDNGIWPMYFNGNDAVALVTNEGSTLIDLFGRIGEGAEFAGWNPYLDGQGVQSYVSQDHTLIRKSSVIMGQSTNPASFDVFAQWDSLPANTFSELGVHQCACAPTAVHEAGMQGSIRLFPNPTNGSMASVIAEQPIREILLYSETGSLLNKMESINDKFARLEVLPGHTGVIIVEIHLQDGTVTRQRLVH